MAYGNEKGIVLRIESGEGEIHIHPESLNNYISKLPKTDNGWIVFKASIKRGTNSRASHHLTPQLRQRKIVGPTHFKTTG